MPIPIPAILEALEDGAAAAVAVVEIILMSIMKKCLIVDEDQA